MERGGGGGGEGALVGGGCDLLQGGGYGKDEELGVHVWCRGDVFLVCFRFLFGLFSSCACVIVRRLRFAE